MEPENVESLSSDYSDDEALSDNASQKDEGRIFEYCWSAPETGEDNNGIYAICPLKEKGYIVAVGGDEKVHLLKLTTETVMDDSGLLTGVIEEVPLTLVPKIHTDSLTSVCLSDNGKYVAVGSMDGRVSVYEVCEGSGLKHVNTLEDSQGSEIESLTFAPSSLALLATTSDGSCFAWHALKGLVNCFAGHKGRVVTGRFVKTGCRMMCLTAGADGYLCIWDPQTGECSGKVSVVHVDAHITVEEMNDPENPTGIMCISVMEDNTVVGCGCADGKVVLVNYETATVVKHFQPLASVVEALQFSPAKCRSYFNDLYIAASDSLGNVYCTPISSDRWRQQIKYKVGSDDVTATHLAWSERAADVKLVAGGSDGSIKIFESRNGECLDTLSGAECICDLKLVSWTADLMCVAAATEEGQVLLWQLD